MQLYSDLFTITYIGIYEFKVCYHISNFIWTAKLTRSNRPIWIPTDKLLHTSVSLHVSVSKCNDPEHLIYRKISICVLQYEALQFKFHSGEGRDTGHSKVSLSGFNVRFVSISNKTVFKIDHP